MAIGHGVKTVATAGTDLPLATSRTALWVIVQAQTDNTGVIAVGGTGVDATVATGTGLALAANGVPFEEPAECLALRADGVLHDYALWPEDEE